MKSSFSDRILIGLSLFAIFSFSGLRAQTTTNILPVGNSITWGKVLKDVPPAGTHGYRDHLYNALIGANCDVNFVGPYPGNPKYDATYHDPPYEGYFRDGRRIGHFLPDSTWDLKMMLDNMDVDSLPDFIILDLGTNDMVTSVPIGDWQTPGTVVFRLYSLMDMLLNYSRSSHNIQRIFLCNLIPKAEDADRGITSPEINARIELFNAKLRAMYDEHPTWSAEENNERVIWIDLFTQFNSYMSTYYTLISADLDPTHPNITGYTAMGEDILFPIVYGYIKRGEEDDFNRAAGVLNGNNRWRASTSIRRSGNGGLAYDGVIYCNDAGSSWSNLAVWPKSVNANSVEMTFHTSSTNFHTVAMAIALDDTIPTQADGYMVWISGGLLRVYTIIHGQSGNNALTELSVPVTQYNGGDRFKVNYRTTIDRNSFDISINGSQIATVHHSSNTWGKNSTFYSGVLFKGGSGVPPGSAAMVTNFLAESGAIDPVRPGAITYFEAVTADYNSITLRWDATGDDGSNGTASRYDLRISSTAFASEADYDNADVVSGLSVPLASGSRETFKVRGLNSGQRYWFVIRAIDDWGNLGAWSQPKDKRTLVPQADWDRFTTLTEWNYNSGDYDKDTRPGTAGEFTNINASQTWPTSIAVYKGRFNPSTVSLVWGNEVTYGPPQGSPPAIENGGIALMLNSDQPNADGYLIFVRTAQKAIYLYSLSNGRTGTLIDAVPYIIEDNLGNPLYPGEDDTMKVVLDWENTAYNRFDVYVNSQVASERALYDNQKRQSGGGTKYSGVFLSSLYGVPGRNNNVFAFGTVSVTCSDIQVSRIPLTITDGIVKTTVPEPLLLEVADCNQNPKARWPVYYWVSQAQNGATISAPAVVNDPIRMEAEWGNVTPSGAIIDVLEHHKASRGKYVEFSTGSAQTGYLELKFTVVNPGDYYFWGRGVATGYYQQILWVQLDGAPANLNETMWRFLGTNYSANEFDFKWGPITLNGTVFHRTLNAGEHILRIYKGHNGVKLDKILATRSSGYQPVGVDTVKTLFTGANGNPYPPPYLKLGARAGINIVNARIFGSDEVYEWQVLGRAAPPTVITPNSNTMDQTGVARDTLNQSFEVTLTDPDGNVTPNMPVIWRVVQGDGRFLNNGLQTYTMNTDPNGKATARLVLGIMDSVNIVNATFTGYTGTLYPFTGRVTSGLIATIQTISPVKQKHYVGDILPNHVKVKILDDKDTAIGSIPVHFEISQGVAHTGTQPKITAADGIAQDTLWYGSTSSVVKVRARVSTQTSEIFTDSVYYKATKIRYYAGDNGIALLNDTLSQRIKVQIMDSYNRPISNHPVKFITKTPRDHGWKFPGDKDSVITYTNYNGVAGTNIRAGLVHGKYADLVLAHANDGFFKLAAVAPYTSPVKFTLYAKSKASRLEKFSRDSLEGIVTEKLSEPIVVRMLDAQGQPVAGQPVDFKIEAGGGHFEGSTPANLDTTVYTFGDGLVGVEYYLGETAGQYNNVIKVTATNGVNPLYPGQIIYHFSAKASNADSLALLPPKNVTGTVGKSLAQSNRVQVFDAAKNGVTGVSVIFSVLSGGGTLNNSSDTTKTIKTQTTEGIASVLWKLGTKAGQDLNKLQARCYNGIYELKGSPVYFFGSGTADIVDKDSSFISTSGSTIASGTDTCWIHVTLLDQYRNPVSGKNINIKVTGGTNYYDSKIGPTSKAGQAKGYLISPISGLKIIEATVEADNIKLSHNGEVVFEPNNAARIQPIFGSGQIGNVGTISKDSLAVKVTDQMSNSVANKRVYFQITSTKGGSLLRNDALSDVNGIAATYIIYGPEPGEYTIQAIANDPYGNPLDGSPSLFMTTAKIGNAVTMFMVDGNGQQGPAGQVLPNPFVVGVRDVDGQAVSGVEIKFEVEAGDGQIASSAYTNAYGYAEVYFRTGTESGATSWVKAYNSSLSGSPIRFSAKSTTGLASEISNYSGDDQTGVIGQTLANPLIVKVIDAFGNAVSGYNVTFVVVSGSANFGDEMNVVRTTDGSGLASVNLDLGFETGPVRVEARGNYLKNSPVIFNLMITTVQPDILVPLSDLSLVVSTSGYLPGPIRVQVQDAHGNGVPGVSVYFTKDTGDGQIIDAETKSILGDQIVVSDTNGVAMIQFRAGSSVGTARVRAVSGENTLQFVIEVHQNASLPILNKSLISSLYTVSENDQINPLTVILAASDADGNTLHFVVEQVGAVSRPDNMLLITESALTARIRWVPGFDDAGDYEFIARVVDSNGGFDEKQFDVEVRNSPQAPQIVHHIPVSQDTTLFAGSQHRFWIEATDPDYDVLTYKWRMDALPIGDNSSLLLWNVPSNMQGIHLLSVQVSDGVLNDNTMWAVDIVPPVSVELAEFYALFDLHANAVEVIWSTLKETRNTGFHVVRSTQEDGTYQQITESPIPTNSNREYRFIDRTARPGFDYYYKLMDIGENGQIIEHGPVKVQIPMPDQYVLYQNYPNPFNPVTVIRYEIPERDHIKILIYNMRGQLVTLLVDSEQDPGYYESEWDGLDLRGQDVSTGLYIYRLQSTQKIITKRMVKMK